MQLALQTTVREADLFRVGFSRCMAILHARACGCGLEGRSLGLQEVEMPASCLYTPPVATQPGKTRWKSLERGSEE